MRVDGRKYVLPVLLVCLSLVVSLLIAEMAVRRFWPAHRGSRSHNKLFVEHHTLLGWTKHSNFEGIHRTAEYAITEKFNSRGIRGPEYSYAKKQNETRIMILGDSFAEGYCVEFDDLFSESLKAHLNQQKTKYYEVINTGTGGWSTDQEYLFFVTEGFKYRPDIVMLLFYHNDVWPNNQSTYWRGGKPLFKIESNELVLSNTPVPKPHPRKPRSWNRRVGRWLKDNSDLYCLSQKAMEEAAPMVRHLMASVAVQSNSSRPCRELPDRWVVFYRNPESGAIDRAWEITDRLLVELRNEVEKVHATLIIVNVPWQATVYPSEWRDFVSKYCLDPKKWDLDQPRRRLAEFCKQEGILWYDLTEPLREYARSLQSQGKRIYFPYDGHWTPIGQERVGQLLARYLQHKGL
ncbi:MAG: SGNH/GDSL hydrolase family protein [Deltaproteobacteria bacterium]